MDLPNVSPEGVGGFVATLMAGALGFRRLFSTVRVRTAEDQTSIAAINAQNAIIANLQKELERIANNFGRVLVQLDKSHRENTELRSLNLSLQDQISELNDAFNKAREQLNSFNRLRQQCGGCKVDEQTLAYRKVDG